MKNIILKIWGRFVFWYTRSRRPYWCNWCPRRYRRESDFHEHYVKCPEKIVGIEKAKADREAAIKAIAPRNRVERRKMAKKAGAIKDWKSLNG